MGNAIDKIKETTVEQNNELKKDGLNKQVRQAFPQSVNVPTTTQNDNNKLQQQIGGVRTNNKETDKSWINKIKKGGRS